MRRWIIGLAAPLALLAVAASAAPAKKVAGQAAADYGGNLISVTTPDRASAFAPTNDCTVWINAEGLGAGPAQLGGLHGMAMHINEAPRAGEPATPFAVGLASLKAAYPNAPAWVFATVEKNRAAIQAGCAADHPEPFKVRSITAADRSAK
jgi:hypothetical protein